MKPQRIMLVRHGESEGNADPGKHATVPDHALSLTEKGVGQAQGAGQRIREAIGTGLLQAYLSPYRRTRQTFQHIRENLAANVQGVVEDPRLREQDWGHLRAEEVNEVIDRERDAFGVFYYRIPDGESCADVFDRVSTFLETLHRDFAKPDYPDNALIVTHGLTLRLFLMRWLHWTVEEFESLRNPENCQMAVLELKNDGKYQLTEPLKRKRECPRLRGEPEIPRLQD